MSHNLSRALAYLIALRNRKRRICDDYDRVEAFVLGMLQKAKLTSVERGRYSVRRVKVPTIACRTCGAPKEGVEQLPLPKDFTPERLEIRSSTHHTHAA